MHIKKIKLTVIEYNESSYSSEYNLETLPYFNEDNPTFWSEVIKFTFNELYMDNSHWIDEKIMISVRGYDFSNDNEIVKEIQDFIANDFGTDFDVIPTYTSEYFKILEPMELKNYL